jgi:Fe-S-cluster-containing dehydrogenase component/anaerobic selenocysteine-containing dehydrogenase
MRMMNPIDTAPAGISRRRFLALLGASAAFASGVTACSKIDRGTIVPYTRKPLGVVPGIADHYASTFQEGMTAYSVLVKTREGRPIHIEGNDEHPHFRGKTSLRTIADILRLYDPDRLRQPLVDRQPVSWEQAEAKVLAALKGARNAGKPVILFTGAVLSPTRRALIGDFKRVLPGLVHVPFEPLAPHAERAAAMAAFGEAVSPRYRFDRAAVVVSFDNDFLGTDPNAPIAVREFAAWRRVSGPHDSMNRLWVFEGGMTVTGAKADHRFAIRPSCAAAVAFALARTLSERHGVALPSGLKPETLAAFDLDKQAGELLISAALLHALAADLARAGRTALVLAGPSASVETHIAAHLLNTMLGAEGQTVETAFTPGPVDVCTFEDLRKHVTDMKSARYHAALFWDVNPAYFCPDRALWTAAVAAVPRKVFIGLHPDETARECQIVLPEHHWLEAWGDYEASADLLSLQQPTIGPLYDTKQGEDLLLDLMRALGGAAPADYHEYLKARWQKEVFPAGSLVPFEAFWSAALHDGILRRPAQPRSPRTLQAAAIEQAVTKAATPTTKGFELLVQPGVGVYDGRYANSGWLQELPDPVTRVTWLNPLAVSPADAQRLNLTDGDVVQVEVGGRRIEIPVLVQPGQARGVVSAALGYGRDALSVAQGVGVNLYPLLDETSTASNLRVGAALIATGKRVRLPLAQTHQTMEGRDIIRSWTLAEYGKHRREESDLPTLYPEQRFPEHKWGMAIDLSTCVGCGGCVIACQSENNVPTVGPEQVLKGREMHWIRIDRYYEGDAEAPRVLHQPMLCQQCDNAPCENVCPVNATTHSADGLNQMAYNRCVGTRYCANNCPFKVRRFNFLDFTGATPDAMRLAYNPEVTVRPRGVMEKCTFCVQRIEDFRLRAKAEARPIRDGEIIPACAAACPAEAIVFGDLKDPNSAVSRLSRSQRGYHVLAELGIRPSVTYLAGVTNPAGDGGRHAV